LFGYGLRWRRVSRPEDIQRAERLYRDILDNVSEPVRLNVWAQYSLYRLMGIGYLEEARNGLSHLDNGGERESRRPRLA